MGLGKGQVRAWVRVRCGLGLSSVEFRRRVSSGHPLLTADVSLGTLLSQGETLLSSLLSQGKTLLSSLLSCGRSCGKRQELRQWFPRVLTDYLTTDY